MERHLDFTSHLRDNGLNPSLENAGQSLKVMQYVDILQPDELRSAYKAIYCYHPDSFNHFDDYFDSFWMNQGRQSQRQRQSQQSNPLKNRQSSLSLFDNENHTDGEGALDTPEDQNDDGESASSGEGRLVATKVVNKKKVDFREYVREEDKAQAEEAARRLAHAIRYRRSRRKKANLKGQSIDLRRIIRKSIARGGEPIELVHKKPPIKPVHFVMLLDVSGSMQAYARVFLSFLKGLVGQEQTTDAYLFNTRLTRISDVMRDKDTLRALNKLSLMASEFGGGTRIGDCLNQFLTQYGARTLNSRSVVMIMSDGYDTGPADMVGDALHKIKKKGCRIIWLNPLLGWKDYQPIAASMKAAKPYLDGFAACNTLADLAELEKEFSRL
jgi:uncharacterized protein with von Willebrand factor type A (vWA) domain